MESIGAMHVGEWNGMCSSEEAEFMAELLGNCSLPNEVMSGSTNFMVSPAFHGDSAAMYSSDETSMCSLSQGTSFSGILFPFSSQESYYSSSALSHHVSGTNNDDLMTMDYCKNGFRDDGVDVMGGEEFLNRDISNDSTQSGNERGIPVAWEEKISSPSESKKRSRVPCDVPRSKKSIKCSNDPKKDDDYNNNNNNNSNNNNAVVIRRHTSSNYCSEDESNEMTGANSCSTSKGKRATNSTRASRGSATDPQSLYARKRRERINERLKILQTLVPNGTKVDISTMLEEAVQYVKFLQLQIKLLSSDDLWMYSPIAYNGMDIGLDLRMSTAAQQSS